MILQSDRLIFKSISLEDLNAIHELHSLPETDEFNTLGIPESIEVTKLLIEDWIEKMNVYPIQRYVFSIEKKESGFIGLIGINIGKPKNRSAEIWFKLHRVFWNMGYATEAVKRIVQLCFNELNIHRIEAGCAVGNMASKRVLEKAGMIQEGMCRQILPIRGQWVDNFIFAILDTDL